MDRSLRPFADGERRGIGSSRRSDRQSTHKKTNQPHDDSFEPQIQRDYHRRVYAIEEPPHDH